MNEARSNFESSSRSQRHDRTDGSCDEWKLRAQELECKIQEQVRTESNLREMRFNNLQADLEKRREVEEDETHETCH